MGQAVLYKLLVVLTLLNSLKASPLQGSQKDKQGPISPKSYTLNIQLFPDEETYTGDVVIKIASSEDTNTITLNANNSLKIEETKAALIKSNGVKEELKIKEILRPDEKNTLNVVLEKPLNAATECEIHVKFSGTISTNTTKGIFKRSFLDAATGKSALIIGSDFKPRNASSVFPCFDDPSFKVPFDVSIQRPTKFNALSTMLLSRSVEMGKGWHKDIFETSPSMAASSLAIFISDLKPLFYKRSDVQVRIWPVPELSQVIKHNRSDIIHAAIKKYEEMFGIKYPLLKLDYVALPASCDINVDSWGLIISSNNKWGNDPLNEKWIITSELADQWLGHLVTGSVSEESSENLIQQGFHQFVSYFYVKKDEDLDWVSSGIYPTYYELGSPTPRDDVEIRRMCSTSHATAVYRMLSYILTDQTFSTALKNFMRNKQYKTYTTNDFWDALNTQAQKDGSLPADMNVKEIATSWLARYRLPYVTVTRNYNENSALLTQRLFIRKRPLYKVKSEEELLWKVPIVLKTEDNLDFAVTKPSYWLTQRDLKIKNVAAKSDQIVIVNPEEMAPYIVNYDKTNWRLLAEFLQSDEREKIPVVTRAKLVHDALNLAYSGNLDFGTALNMTVFLKDETEYPVWRPFFIMFDHIGRHIGGTKALMKYEKFVTILAKPLYERLKEKQGNKEPTDFLREVRAVLVNIGYENLMKEANVAYEKWMVDPNAGYTGVMGYLCPIFKYGTPEQWEFGLNVLLHLDGKPNIERYYLFKSLVGCTHDWAKIKRFLNMTLFEQGNVFTDDDFNYATFMLTGDAEGFMATFEYLRDNFSVLKTRLKNKPEIWKQLVYTATNLYKTQDGLNKVSEFYTKHRGEFGEAEKTMQESLKKIKEEVQWSDDNMGPLEDWLDNYILKNSPQN